jgi:hypothetical protein
MSENAIDSETISKPAPDTAKPKGARKAGKKAKPAKKVGRAKKAEVIAMMKRAKGAMLPKIMKATGWQPHTVRASSASWAAKEGKRWSRPRTPRANGRTRSGNSVRQVAGSKDGGWAYTEHDAGNPK